LFLKRGEATGQGLEGDTLIDQRLPSSNTDGRIDRQHFDRRSPDVRLSGQDGATPPEVIVPAILSRVEEPGESIRVGVYAGDIRPLVVITLDATKSEIAERGGAAMLLGDDVVQHVTESGARLGHSAILAPISREPANLVRDALCHRPLRGRILSAE
jgi:hypothetical protein